MNKPARSCLHLHVTHQAAFLSFRLSFVSLYLASIFAFPPPSHPTSCPVFCLFFFRSSPIYSPFISVAVFRLIRCVYLVFVFFAFLSLSFFSPYLQSFSTSMHVRRTNCVVASRTCRKRRRNEVSLDPRRKTRGLTCMAAQEGKCTLIHVSRFRCVKQDSMIIQLLRAYFAVYNDCGEVGV